MPGCCAHHAHKKRAGDGCKFSENIIKTKKFRTFISRYQFAVKASAQRLNAPHR